MFRWGSRTAVAVAALVCAASAAAQAPRASTNATRPETETLSLPVQDLELPIASLDGTVVATARRVTLQADVLFAFGSSTLGDRSRSRVAAAASELRTRRPGRLRVIGHTDSKGSAGDNLRLSLRRAAAVRRALATALEPDAPTVRIEGRGESDPAAGNIKDGADDPGGRARNRRVEIVFDRRDR